ncbi:hypothetical protein BDE02_01G203200 [Populus trichocarpa]|nr:hypothetical protein BDE02_01G203200 [Populus trichocarpa]
MVVRGGEDRESMSFPEAAGGAMTRRVIEFSSLSLGSRWRDWRPTVKGLKSSGEELTKQCWFGHRGQCWNRQRRQNRQSRQNRLTVSLDRLDSPRLDKKDCWSGHYWGSGSHANRGGSAAHICAAAGSSGRSGSADFSTNMGWTMDCPGQAGKFVQGHADETALV